MSELNEASDTQQESYGRPVSGAVLPEDPDVEELARDLQPHITELEASRLLARIYHSTKPSGCIRWTLPNEAVFAKVMRFTSLFTKIALPGGCEATAIALTSV